MHRTLPWRRTHACSSALSCTFGRTLSLRAHSLPCRPFRSVPQPRRSHRSTPTVTRDQASEVLRAYGPWLQRWHKRAERERRKRPLRALYDKVYAWHQQLALEHDRTELVLANRLLAWTRPGEESAHRHLLAQRVETSMDRRTAQVTGRLSAEGALAWRTRTSWTPVTAG